MENELKKNFFEAFNKLVEKLPERVNFVIKVDRKQGNYEGRDYDNTVLVTVAWRCASDADFDRKADGEPFNKVVYFENIKVKTSLFNAMPCAVGDCIVASYNRYGQVQDLHKI